MPTSLYRVIYDLAEDQMGYITTAQARTVGVSPMTLVMMKRRGTLERASHGVYHLDAYPVHPLGQYMQATLWPYDHPGVLSHETALSLYKLSDVDPPKVHITVPANFRVRRAIPDYLEVHRGTLRPIEVTQFEGMPITTVERAFGDCIASHLGPALLVGAIEEARSRGLITADTAGKLEQQLAQASAFFATVVDCAFSRG
ncbi:MAG: type IV toxin-antitoxin system AbiEi family antitoxin domain-containing protein [Gemmatimonas sp.]